MANRRVSRSGYVPAVVACLRRPRHSVRMYLLSQSGRGVTPTPFRGVTVPAIRPRLTATDPGVSLGSLRG